MIKYNNNTINDWDFGTSNINKVYRNNSVCYYKISGTSPTPTFDGKWKATYSDSSVTSAECDSTSAITQSEISLTNLVSVEIGDCVTSIGNSAYSGYTTLSNVTIPNSVTSIGSRAFQGCTSLQSITIPNSVTSIKASAFRECTSITSVTISNGVTEIPSSAFRECTSLTSIDIPSGVTTIGGYAFQGCTSLQSITIPSGVTSLNNYAFSGCSSLTSVTVEATTPSTLGSDTFYDTNDCPIYVPSESVEAYKSSWLDYASRIFAIP